MGFSFDFQGPRDDVAASLDMMTFDDDLHGDSMGDEVRDLVSAYIKQGGEPGPGLRYVVKASGHSNSNDGHTIWLNLHVSVEPLNAAGTGMSLSEACQATEALTVP